MYMGMLAARTFNNPVDWLFRSRVDDRITVAQFPNLPLGLFLVALVARLVLHPGGPAGTGLAVVSAVLLLAWSALELLRGVNPFRRLLGAAVGASQLVMLFTLR
jgi:hypothetical protein